MYVRDAKNREEVWLLDHIEAMDLDDTAFRSRDYVIAIDEDSGAKAGFGRIRIHTGEANEQVCELTSIGVLDGWRKQGVGGHVIERLIEYASDQSFDRVYALTAIPDYFAQFGFQPIDEEDVPTVLDPRLAAKRERHDGPVVPMWLPVDRFRMPARLRERFKSATEAAPETTESDPDEVAEEFGIDPEEATYKYDPSGRRR